MTGTWRIWAGHCTETGSRRGKQKLRDSLSNLTADSRSSARKNANTKTNRRVFVTERCVTGCSLDARDNNFIFFIYAAMCHARFVRNPQLCQLHSLYKQGGGGGQQRYNKQQNNVTAAHTHTDWLTDCCKASRWIPADPKFLPLSSNSESDSIRSTQHILITC